MTQRVFDVENEKDMADLWGILPDDVKRIFPVKRGINHIEFEDDEFNTILFKINWHDKTEITRPIQEATFDDIGKICIFWDMGGCYYGVLTNVGDYKFKYQMDNNSTWQHCRRLTKQEIEELC